MTVQTVAHNAPSFQEYNHQLRVLGLFPALAKARNRKGQELLVDPPEDSQEGFDGNGFFEEEACYGC